MCSAVHDSTAVRDCAALDLEDEAFAIGNAASAAGDAALEEARVRPVPGIADRVQRRASATFQDSHGLGIHPNNALCKSKLKWTERDERRVDPRHTRERRASSLSVTRSAAQVSTLRTGIRFLHNRTARRSVFVSIDCEFSGCRADFPHRVSSLSRVAEISRVFFVRAHTHTCGR